MPLARSLRRLSVLVCAIVALLALPAAAGAVAIAYIDNGEVWASSLDGTKKVRLAAQVVDTEGKTQKWIDVAQSDGGRIVAVRNVPGRISRFNWLKIWEPDGTSTVEGPLTAPNGWATYTYPLGFDITADGHHLVYGFSNAGYCCPQSFQTGYYVRPATDSSLDPIVQTGELHPSLLGNRVVAHSGNTVSAQDLPTVPYGNTFSPWLDTSGTGLEQNRTDVAANGKLAALELEAWNGGTQTTGKIALLSIQGLDASPTFPAAVDCYVPAAGIAREASLSMDGSLVAWSDDQGLKVAGTPTTGDDPCTMTGTTVVISPTGRSGAIGGANMNILAPTPPAAPGPAPGGGGGSTSPPPPGTATTPTTPPGGSGAPGGTGAAPVLTPPARVSAAALGRGVAMSVSVAAPGTVRLTATVPARRLGRRGAPVVVATGSGQATRAGKLTVRLRLNATGRRAKKRLKGARLTVRVVAGTRSATRTFTLR
jgi:hypothetical protein